MDQKRCVYCAEYINSEAILCRFCNKKIPSSELRKMHGAKNRGPLLALIVVSGIMVAGLLSSLGSNTRDFDVLLSFEDDKAFLAPLILDGIPYVCSREKLEEARESTHVESHEKTKLMSDLNIGSRISIKLSSGAGELIAYSQSPYIVSDPSDGTCFIEFNLEGVPNFDGPVKLLIENEFSNEFIINPSDIVDSEIVLPMSNVDI